VAYDPCAPSIPPSPVAAPVHHHYIHRIVGRIRPRRAGIQKIAHHPFNPDGCARPTAGPLNTPRPLAAGGVGAGKVASIIGAGGATAIGGSLLPPGGSHTTPTPVSPVAVTTPSGDPGNPVVTPPPIPVVPVIVPPGPPVVVVPSGPAPTPPTSVSEPATLAVFAMALFALWVARNLRPMAAR
jgi:hypothetical protein